jgi:hypothetical protein
MQKPPCAVHGVAAAVIQQAAPKSAQEICAPALQRATEAVAQLAAHLGGGEPEPCSYEAEVAWIVGQFALRIEGIRRSGMDSGLCLGRSQGERWRDSRKNLRE